MLELAIVGLLNMQLQLSKLLEKHPELLALVKEKLGVEAPPQA